MTPPPTTTMSANTISENMRAITMIPTIALMIVSLQMFVRIFVYLFFIRRVSSAVGVSCVHHLIRHAG